MERSRLGRALAILAVVALGIAVVSPAFSAAPLTKAKVKKIAKKVAKKQINTLVPGMISAQAITEGELDRFGPVKLNIGGTATLGTWGPFSLAAECSDTVIDADLDVLGEVFVRTTEANSVYASLWDETDFGPGDNDELWAENNGPFDIDPGDPPEPGSYDETSYAAAPSGAHIWGVVNVSTNLAGAHCTFTGFTFSVAPNA